MSNLFETPLLIILPTLTTTFPTTDLKIRRLPELFKRYYLLQPSTSHDYIKRRRLVKKLSIILHTSEKFTSKTENQWFRKAWTVSLISLSTCSSARSSDFCKMLTSATVSLWLPPLTQILPFIPRVTSNFMCSPIVRKIVVFESSLRMRFREDLNTNPPDGIRPIPRALPSPSTHTNCNQS